MTKRLYFAVNKVNKVRFGEVPEDTKVNKVRFGEVPEVTKV